MSAAGSPPASAESALAIPGYHLEELIERRSGAWSSFRATGLSDGRRVALTIVTDDLAADPDYGRRLERVVRQAAGLDHPHLVRVRETGRAEQRLYVVADFEEAVPLDAALRGGVLAPADAVWLLGPVADALDHAHGHGLAHGGVAPRNILVAEDRYALLANVGLTDAAVAAREPDPGARGFVAPEVAGHVEPTPSSDVYGFAATVLWLLTGAGPRASGASAGTPAAVSLPDGLEAVLARSLADDPPHRARSAGELLGAIARVALPGEPAPVVLRDGSAPGPRPTRPRVVPAPPSGTDPEPEEPQAEAPVARPTTVWTTAPVGHRDARWRPAARAAGHTPRTRRRLTGRGRRRALIPLLALAAVGAAIGGILLARDADGPQERAVERPIGAVASTPELALQVPAGWRLARAVTPIAGLPLDESMQLEPADGTPGGVLVVGVVRQPDAGLLPRDFASRVTTEPVGERAAVGSYPGYRYRGLVLRRNDQRLNLYAVPTTAGAATVACLARPEATAFLPVCEDAADTLELKSLVPKPL